MRKPMAVGLSLAICFAAEARVQNQGGPSNTSNVSDTAHSATKAAHPARIYVAPEVEATKLIRRVNSVYPERAEVEGITGTVVCRVIVSTDGSVKELEYVSGPEVLKQAAMDAVKEWRYKPTMLNGEPVEVDTTVQVIFALNEPDQSGAQPPNPAPPTILIPSVRGLTPTHKHRRRTRMDRSIYQTLHPSWCPKLAGRRPITCLLCEFELVAMCRQGASFIKWHPPIRMKPEQST